MVYTCFGKDSYVVYACKDMWSVPVVLCSHVVLSARTAMWSVVLSAYCFVVLICKDSCVVYACGCGCVYKDMSMWTAMSVVLSTRTGMWSIPVVLSARTAMWSIPGGLCLPVGLQ